MSEFYTRTGVGTIPLDLEAAKSYLRLDGDADDAFVDGILLPAVCDAGELYTKREFRANTYTLRIDAFPDRLCIRRGVVASVASVKYQDSSSQAGVELTVPATDYYFKNGPQFAELLVEPLGDGWPSDVNSREGSIVVTFTTTATPSFVTQAKVGMLRHLAYLYENRGDADPTAEDSIFTSGAAEVYDLFRIASV